MHIRSIAMIWLFVCCVLHAANTAKVPPESNINNNQHRQDDKDNLEGSQVQTYVVHNNTDKGVEKGKISSLKQHASFVGVTAWKQAYQSYGANDIITFERIIVNEGDAYKELSNWFVCPSNGVYFVSLSCRLYSIDIKVEIVKESERILFIYDQNNDGINYFATDTNAGLVRCNEGERIWVQGWGSGYVDGDSIEPYTTFSVLLMHDDGTVPNQFHTSFVGFTAWKGQNQTYGAGEIIHFDNILFNEGGYFVDNKFVCPKDGTYYTSINARKTAFDMTHLAVTKGLYAILHVDDVSALNSYTTLSNSRMFECLQGEEVSVQSTGIGEVSGATDSPYTTFTVMLIQEEDIEEQKHNLALGFSAWKRSSQEYTLGDTIEFDGVFLNIGDHYQPALSRFVCPLDGIYYISLTLKRLLTDDLLVDVLKETALVLRMYDQDDENAGNSVSNSALVKCFAGEDIVVKGWTNGAVRGDQLQAVSTFNVLFMSPLA